MKLVHIYQCLCDETRLRILNLLAQRPLCVCHLQEILGRPQAQVSQHLARMKKDGLVESSRHNNWMIYSLPRKAPAALEAHLQCLQDCVQSEPVFKGDLRALRKLRTGLMKPFYRKSSTRIAPFRRQRHTLVPSHIHLSWQRLPTTQ